MQKRRYKEFSSKAAIKVDSKEGFLDVSSIFGNAAALFIVRAIYNTFLTPIHITAVFLVVGMLSSYFVYKGGWQNLAVAAVLMQVKNILDAVDGSLARARNTPSRIGRFFDSIADFIVGFCAFAAIYACLRNESANAPGLPLVIAAFLCSMIQCSYYVYYNIQYLNAVNRKTTSRTEETFIDSDRDAYNEKYKQRILVCLQSMFIIMYGWQDKLIKAIDLACLSLFRDRGAGKVDDKTLLEWYNIKHLLKLGSVLGLGTQLFLFSIMAIFNQLHLYLWVVVVIGNLYMLWLIVYRIWLFKRILASSVNSVD